MGYKIKVPIYHNILLFTKLYVHVNVYVNSNLFTIIINILIIHKIKCTCKFFENIVTPLIKPSRN